MGQNQIHEVHEGGEHAVPHGAVTGESLRFTAGALRDWMREPDLVETASLEWIIEWINRRPLRALTAYDAMLRALENVKVASVGNKVFIGVITKDGYWSAEMTEDCGREMALEWGLSRDAAIAHAAGDVS